MPIQLKTVRGWGLSLLLLLGLSTATFADKIPQIKWETLVPNNLSVEEMEKIMSKAAVYDGVDAVFFDPKYFSANKDLDGKTLKIPGYVAPLDFDATHIDEFLLVPYMGACIHTPPPPPNQIIYVKLKKKIPIISLYDTIIVTGVLHTKTKKSEIANAVYTMDGMSVKPYK